MTIILQRFVSIAALAGAAALSGCAALNTVNASVASYGDWPAEAKPGTYAFDRLPSQQAHPQRQQAIEADAAQALAGAGFRPAAAGEQPAVMIQLGARTERFEQAPWDDPFWWGGPRRWGYGGWAGYGPAGPWGPYGFHRRGFWAPFPSEPDVYLNEVALLIRDTATGKALYETRASNDGYSGASDRLLTAMFDAAMRDFPRTDDRPHNVQAMLPPAPPVVVPAPAPAGSAPGA